MNFKALFFVVVAVISLSSCSKKQNSPAPITKPQPVEKPVKLVVAALTDLHGALEPSAAKSADGKIALAGGAATIAAQVELLRNSVNAPFLLIDGGDLFQGTMESNTFEGSPVIQFYNYLGVAAAALGNHEFDFGPEGEKSVPRSIQDDPRGALRKRSEEAKFPFLAVNVREENGSIPSWVKPSVVREVGGLRVGIIGAATEKTPETTNRMNLVGLRFLPPTELIKQEAERLREEEAVDAVILTMHEGGSCADNSLDKQEDLSSCDITDVFKIVEALPYGTLDVVVAGHTHRGVAKRIGRTVIMQAYSNGKYLEWANVPTGSGNERPSVQGLAEICQTVLVYEENGVKKKSCDSYKLKLQKGELEPATFLGQTVEPDAKVNELLKPFLDKVREIKNTPLNVTLLTNFTGGYSEESALGNLVADATRASLDGMDMGLANGGGLRNNLQAGPLLYGHIFSVLPFDNQLAVMRVDGEVVRKLIGVGISGNNGALLWSGLKYRSKDCTILEASVNNEPLSPVKIYSIATSDYLALGGSGISSIGIAPTQVEVFWDRPYILRDVVSRVLPQWKKDLSNTDFFQKDSPRQMREGKCGTL